MYNYHKFNPFMHPLYTWCQKGSKKSPNTFPNVRNKNYIYVFLMQSVNPDCTIVPIQFFNISLTTINNVTRFASYHEFYFSIYLFFIITLKNLRIQLLWFSYKVSKILLFVKRISAENYMQSDFKKHVLSLTFDNHCNFSLSYLHASDFKKAWNFISYYNHHALDS